MPPRATRSSGLAARGSAGADAAPDDDSAQLATAAASSLDASTSELSDLAPVSTDDAAESSTSSASTLPQYGTGLMLGAYWGG